jgi:soluble lytic murein transglycosylase-like protein
MGLFLNEAKYDAAIAAAQAAFPSVPVAVIKAVVATESGFRADAVRGEPQIGDASYGLMQVLYQTARSLGYTGTPEGLKQPDINVYFGTKLLAQNFARTGNWSDAFSAYNGGFRPDIGFGARATKPLRIIVARDSAGNPTAYKDVPVGQYANQDYVDKVMNYWRQYAPTTTGGSPPITAAGITGAPAMVLFALLLGGLAYLVARRFG